MKDSKHDLIFELLICIMAAIMFVLFVGMLRDRERAQEVSQAYDRYPVAGMTEYLSHLAKHSLALNEPSDSDISEMEAFFNSVGCLDESEEPVEEVTEDERTEEDLLNAYFGYTPDDAELELWQTLVMDECGHTEPDAGVAAVADVVANRVRSERFPNTIRGVIYQTGQFQPVGDSTLGKFPITDRVREICSECICEGIRYPYLLFTAGAYNSYCKPGEVIGNHYFGY